MNSPKLIAIAFLAGLGVGWFGKNMLESYQRQVGTFVSSATGGNQDTAAYGDAIATNASVTTQSELAHSSGASVLSQNAQDNDSQLESQRRTQAVSGLSVIDSFDKLLKDRRYFDYPSTTMILMSYYSWQNLIKPTAVTLRLLMFFCWLKPTLILKPIKKR